MTSLRLHFISLFPETINVWLTSGILKKAHAKNLFEFHVHQLRDYSNDKHHSVDDLSYGGGGGMVLKIEPLVNALEAIRAEHPDRQFRVLCPSPSGRRIDHEMVMQISEEAKSKDLIFVCGRYEGIDQRFIDHFVDLEFSFGDFVVTAGELPSLAFADALIRQIEGSLGNPLGAREESFALKEPQDTQTLLEYPQYTRPAVFRGWEVPPELLEGNHEKIRAWRIRKAREKTLRVRPDMLS